jgi:gas vesicle protein
MANRDTKMGLGLVLGLVVGALGGIFLAPKSGKENRDAVAKKWGELQEMIDSGEMQEKVQKIFGDVSDESMRLYANAREGVLKGIEEMKNMDSDDYARLVQNVIDKVKEGTKANADKLAKLREDLIKDWPEMKEEVETKKRTRRKTTKEEPKAEQTEEKA